MVLVEIYIPSFDKTCDFLLNEESQVKSIIGEIEEMLTKESKSIHSNNEFVLCSMDTRSILPMESTLLDLNIQNGSRLMIV